MPSGRKQRQRDAKLPDLRHLPSSVRRTGDLRHESCRAKPDLLLQLLRTLREFRATKRISTFREKHGKRMQPSLQNGSLTSVSFASESVPRSSLHFFAIGVGKDKVGE